MRRVSRPPPSPPQPRRVSSRITTASASNTTHLNHGEFMCHRYANETLYCHHLARAPANFVALTRAFIIGVALDGAHLQLIGIVAFHEPGMTETVAQVHN